MQRIAFTAGYAGRSPEDLLEALKRLDNLPDIGAMVIDIRISAKSKDPRWRWQSLRTFFAWRYHWMPSLGNKRFKDGPPVEIVNLEEGVEYLNLIPPCVPLILLCACQEPEGCHRTVVADALRERGWRVEELSWEAK